MISKRIFTLIFGASIFSCSAISANENLIPHSTLEACSKPYSNIDNAIKPFKAIGWNNIQKNTLTNTTISDLAWIYIARHLNGNVSAEQISSQMEFQKKTVAAISQKKDIEVSQSRFMQIGSPTSSNSLIITWQRFTPQKAGFDCHIVFSEPVFSPVTTLIEKLAKTEHGKLPDLLPLDPELYDEDHVKGSITTTLINSKNLMTKLNTNVLIAGAVETSFSFRLPEVTP